MPKSSEAVAVSMIVLPRAAVAGALSVMPGPASEIGIGAWMFGNWPVSGSDCGPERNGRNCTALEVVPSSVTTGSPLTGFSGTGGLNAGEISGPVFVEGVKRTPQ